VEPFLSPFVCEGDFFDALARMFREKQSGVLTARWQDAEKRFFLQQQEIVRVQSNESQDSLVPWLVEKKVLDCAMAAKPNLDIEALVNVLLTASRISIEDLKEAYLTLLKRSAASVFLWPSSTCAFAPARIVNQPPAGIPLGDLLPTAARRWLLYEKVKNSLPSNFNIERAPFFQEAIASLRLDSEESAIASCLNGKVTLEMLKGTARLPEEKIVRALFLFHKIQAIQVSGAESEPVSTKPILEAVRIEAVKSEKEMEAQSQAKASNVDDAFLLAEKAFEEGNFWKVTQLCDEAIQVHPDARLFFLKALAYKRHPKFRKDAEDSFHQAIRHAPENADFHMSLAKFYMAHHLPIRARTHCDRALAIVPNHKEALKLSYEILDLKPGQGECWCVSRNKPV